VLIEKETTVPDAYPLTLAALVAGCNQKSNRDPQMEVAEYEVEGALRSLMDKGWVTRQEREGGRTHRYAHAARDQLGLERLDLAILSELLCRGPQAPGALKPRVARMVPVASAEQIEERLRALAARPVPFVELLPRQPRERDARWRHRLGPAEASGAAAPGAIAPPAQRAPRGEDPSAPAAEAADEVVERIEALEAALADLAERLDRLEGR
jgi:uncharacterized protein YceH (UPF0502 family)